MSVNSSHSPCAIRFLAPEAIHLSTRAFPRTAQNPSPTPSTSDNNGAVNTANQEPSAGSTTPNNAATAAANSTSYNEDGTANWGCQDHQKYGCYLDGHKGIICDEVDVATKTGTIDVIFTANPYGKGAIYHLVSPQFAKTNFAGWTFFAGEKYKNTNYPVKNWQTVNASEIALIQITGEQFEKVKNNDQLMAVVNQTGGFKPDFRSTNIKLDGKVFAVRTQVADRTSYALIYVVEQVGLRGKDCYLRVKLKVNGTDTNGDGLPDSH